MNWKVTATSWARDDACTKHWAVWSGWSLNIFWWLSWQDFLKHWIDSMKKRSPAWLWGFWYKQLELPVIEMERNAGGTGLEGKIRSSVLNILSLKCLRHSVRLHRCSKSFLPFLVGGVYFSIPLTWILTTWLANRMWGDVTYIMFRGIKNFHLLSCSCCLLQRIVQTR